MTEEVQKFVKPRLPFKDRLSGWVCIFLGHQFFKMAEKDNLKIVEGFVRCQRCRYQEIYKFTIGEVK